MSTSLLLHPQDLLKYEVKFFFYLTFTNYTLKYIVRQEVWFVLLWKFWDQRHHRLCPLPNSVAAQA